ncbi:MAG: C2 family cysteine protease [Planctomycetota bacterium]
MRFPDCFGNTNFRKFRGATVMRTRKTRTIGHLTEAMEVRQVLAANITATLSGGVLRIEGTDKNDKICVMQSDGDSRNVSVGAVPGGCEYGTFSGSRVNRIEILGLGGDDRIDLRGTKGTNTHGVKVSTKIWGDRAKEQASDGKDQIFGGNGDDQIFGGGGADWIDAESGNDRVDGGSGNDEIYGGDGNDWIKGGVGKDSLYGQAGLDTLVAIDAIFSDLTDGGNDADVLWIDGGKSKDAASNVSSEDIVQRVAEFQPVVDLTLDGDRIYDPAAAGYSSKNFTSLKLFSGDGPSVRDINQGALNDCWLLSAMGEIALRNPQVIKANIADFGDGTFGVHLGDRFYRIDSDLPVDSNGKLVFANLGVEDSAWVALYEKAFAYHRSASHRKAYSYSELHWGWCTEGFKAFGLTAGRTELKNVAAIGLLDSMRLTWIAGGHLTVASTDNAANSVLVNNHAYMVVGFVRGSILPTVTAIKLRNPWGTDGGTLNDGSDDGVVTLSIAEFLNSVDVFEVAWT